MKTIQTKAFHSPNRKTWRLFRDSGRICEIYSYEGVRNLIGGGGEGNSYLRISIVSTKENLNVGDTIEFSRKDGAIRVVKVDAVEKDNLIKKVYTNSPIGIKNVSVKTQQFVAIDIALIGESTSTGIKIP